MKHERTNETVDHQKFTSRQVIIHSPLPLTYTHQPCPSPSPRPNSRPMNHPRKGNNEQCTTSTNASPRTFPQHDTRYVRPLSPLLFPTYTFPSKPWPIIARFLSHIPPNSIGLDSGAGNGKYLPVLRSASEGSWMIALDRSEGLLSVARKEQGTLEECVRGDLCFDGFRRNLFVRSRIRSLRIFNAEE